MTEYDDLPERMDDMELDGYEVIAYTRDVQQAEGFRDLLIDHDIPAALEEDIEGAYKSVSDGIPVLVPAAAANEARDILGELELIEELIIADPDLDDEDDEDVTDHMQPLESDDLSLDDDDPLAADEEEGSC